jgi:hypothetical protein
MSEAITRRRPLRTALTILGSVIGVDAGAASGLQASSRPTTRDLARRR